MSGMVKIRKRRPFSAIPDDILQDIRMRTETRLVLGWLIGRPDGWEGRVKYVQHILGLSRDRWSKSRQERERYGYLQQIRKQRPDGTFQWEHAVTDTPSVPALTIAGKSSDGKTSDEKSGDITTTLKQNKLSTPLNPPVAITQACYEKARRDYQGYDIDAMERAWKEWLGRKRERPRDSDSAFLAWAKTYVQNHPLPFG